MRRPHFRNPWQTETELAAEVKSALEALGWEVHPECHGYDLFAYATEQIAYGPRCRVAPGDTLAVEVKLDAGTVCGLESLLLQILPFPPAALACGETYRYWRPERGAHYLAVASARIAAETTFNQLGVATWMLSRLAAPPHLSPGGFDYYYAEVDERIWTRCSGQVARDRILQLGQRFEPRQVPHRPELVVHVPAGVPSPRTSSAWKVAAVRLMLRLRAGELLTSEDFAEAGVNINRFRQSRWIRDSGQRKGRLYLYTAGDGTNYSAPPDEQWPEIVEALRAKDEVAA